MSTAFFRNTGVGATYINNGPRVSSTGCAAAGALRAWPRVRSYDRRGRSSCIACAFDMVHGCATVARDVVDFNAGAARPSIAVNAALS